MTYVYTKTFTWSLHKNLYLNVHNNLFVIAGNRDKQMSSKSEWLHKLACLYHGLFINKKEQVLDTCNNLDESQGCVEWPVSRVTYCFHLCNILEITKLEIEQIRGHQGWMRQWGRRKVKYETREILLMIENILWIAVSMPVFWFWSCTVALQDVESEWNDHCTIFYNCIWTYNYPKIKV